MSRWPAGVPISNHCNGVRPLTPDGGHETLTMPDSNAISKAGFKDERVLLIGILRLTSRSIRSQLEFVPFHSMLANQQIRYARSSLLVVWG